MLSQICVLRNRRTFLWLLTGHHADKFDLYKLKHVPESESGSISAGKLRILTARLKISLTTAPQSNGQFKGFLFVAQIRFEWAGMLLDRGYAPSATFGDHLCTR